MTHSTHARANPRAAGLVAVAAVLLTFSAPQAHAAQRGADAGRWAPWVGCWQMTGDTAAGTEDHFSRAAGDGVQVCVAPAGGPDRVTLTTRIGGQEALVETVSADATERPVTDPGCTGAQQARWSADGQRVFATATLACADEAPRQVSGVTLIAPGPTWLDVQVIDRSGRRSVRVRRYAPSPTNTPAARAAVLDIDDVIEASRALPDEGLQAMLVESRVRFALSGRRLVDLDNAGVSDDITDLMVAVSYPDRFVVDRRSGTPIETSFDDTPWPFITAGSYYWSPYFYAPFGYPYWGGLNYLDGYGGYGYGGVVVVNPGGGAGGDAPVAGRAVNGRGYTQVSRRVIDAGAGPGGTGGTSGTGSTGTVTTGGYSGGGGGGGGGRTAVARPPGGER